MSDPWDPRLDGWMREALRLAERAEAEGDVPVGAVVVLGEEIIGRGWNRRERDQDPVAHAEVVALREAAANRGRWRLDGATMVVTLEPCAMCAGALVNARMARLVYGAPDPKAGFCGSLGDLVRDPRLNHRLEVQGGLLADESATRLRAFFAARRPQRGS